MPSITLAQARAQLAAWLAASTPVAASRAYEIDTGNGRPSLTRADAAEIRQQVTFWDQKVKSLPGAGREKAYPYQGRDARRHKPHRNRVARPTFS